VTSHATLGHSTSCEVHPVDGQHSAGGVVEQYGGAVVGATTHAGFPPTGHVPSDPASHVPPSPGAGSHAGHAVVPGCTQKVSKAHVVAPQGIAVASSDDAVSVPASVDDSGDDDPLHPETVSAHARATKTEETETSVDRFMSTRSARGVPIDRRSTRSNGAEKQAVCDDGARAPRAKRDRTACTVASHFPFTVFTGRDGWLTVGAVRRHRTRT
jgi:hypothetical protein